MINSFLIEDPHGQRFVVVIKDAPDFEMAERKAMELLGKYVPEVAEKESEEVTGPICLSYKFLTH